MNLIRLADLVVATIALLLFSPILLLIPLLILIDDGGPVFFAQQRLGQHKRKFQIWKFRTMCDGKVTRVGKWLRATALDEFLQFLIILRGEMSIVGPRPLTQADVTRLGWDDASYEKRWNVKPGITGIVQIFGGISASHSWELEQKFLASPSLIAYLKIIGLSAIVNFFGKNRTKKWFPLSTHSM